MRLREKLVMAALVSHGIADLALSTSNAVGNMGGGWLEWDRHRFTALLPDETNVPLLNCVTIEKPVAACEKAETYTEFNGEAAHSCPVNQC